MVQWAGPTMLALDRGIYGGDSLWYHMPFAAHIAGTGSVTELLFTDPLYLNWLYPQNSELLHADGLMLLGDDFISPLLNLGWLAAALFAGWCIGRPYGAGGPAVGAVAAIMSANLLFSRQPGNANNDVVAIALLLASVAILVNARSASARGPLLVAGLAAGLALGTKLTIVPPVGALTIGVIVIAASGERARAAGAWLTGLFVGGGLWYVRDLIASGTPFPFVDIGPLTSPRSCRAASRSRSPTTSPTPTSGGATSGRASRSASGTSGRCSCSPPSPGWCFGCGGPSAWSACSRSSSRSPPWPTW